MSSISTNLDLALWCVKQHGGKVQHMPHGSVSYVSPTGQYFSCRVTSGSSVSIRPATSYSAHGCIFVLPGYVSGSRVGHILYDNSLPKSVCRADAYVVLP